MKKLGCKQIVHEMQMVKGILVGSTTKLYTVSENGVIIFSSTSFDEACKHAN